MPPAVLAEQTPLFFLFSCCGITLLFVGLWSWGMDSVTLVGYRHYAIAALGLAAACRVSSFLSFIKLDPA